MEHLLDPAGNAGTNGLSMDVRVLDPHQLEAIRPVVKAWADSFGVAHLQGLHDKMTLMRATFMPVAKIQLRTRIEKRSISKETAAYKAGTSIEQRHFADSACPIWSLSTHDPVAQLREGEIPQPITQKVRYSDLLHDCSACNANGSVRCGGCEGRGERACGSCRGNTEIKCTACSGAGEKKCHTCNGGGEKKCQHCQSGIRHDGSRCPLCHGRGFNPCNACRDGFINCASCARRGIISCPTCRAAGRVTCGSCGGKGRVSCSPCAGSGKFVTSLSVTSSQSEKLTLAWVFPPNYQELLPENLVAWLQNDVGIQAARELSEHRIDALPAGAEDPRLIAAGTELIAASKRNVGGTSYDDRVNLAYVTSLDRIIKHWYAEHYFPLVKVDYRFEDVDYVLWTIAPGLALASHEHGYARQGGSVFASQGPVGDHFESMLGDAAAALKQGRLGDAANFADATLISLPNLAKATSVKAAILRAQSLAASLGSSMALAAAACVYWARMNANVPASLSSGAMLGIAAAVLAAAAPFMFSRVFYKTTYLAVLAHCAIVSAILVPVVAAMQPRPPADIIVAASLPAPPPGPIAAAVPAAAARALPVPPAAATPGFDCAKASTAVEKIICADSRLAVLDSQLARAYKKSLAQSDDAPSLRSGQRSWLANVRNRCRDADCLAQAYQQQIAHLGVPQ